MATEVTRRGLLMRLGSRDVLVDAARGIVPLWREVASVMKPEAVSVEQAVEALRQRRRGAPAGAVPGVTIVPATPAGTAKHFPEPRGYVAEVRTQSTAQAATGRP